MVPNCPGTAFTGAMCVMTRDARLRHSKPIHQMAHQSRWLGPARITTDNVTLEATLSAASPELFVRGYGNLYLPATTLHHVATAVLSMTGITAHTI